MLSLKRAFRRAAMEAFEIFKHDMILQPPLQHSVSDSPPDKTRLKGKERKKGSVPSLILTSLFSSDVSLHWYKAAPSNALEVACEANWQGSPRPRSDW